MTEKRVILLVDDVEQVGAIAAEYLERKLFEVQVVVFTRPAQALEWLKQAPRVDLILSDNHMAEMGGLQLLEQSRAHKPDAARALMTAYLDLATTPAELGAYGVHALIRKPWNWPDLAVFLGDLLAMGPQERLAAAQAPRAFPVGAFREFEEMRVRKAAPPPAGRSATPAPAEPPRAVPIKVIPPGAQGDVKCPHCDHDIRVALPLPPMPDVPPPTPPAPQAGRPASDDEAARRILAYLRARPGVAQRLAANARPSAAQAARRGPPPRR